MPQEGSTGVFKLGGLLINKIGQVIMSGSGAPTDGTTGSGNKKVAVNGQYWDYTNNLVWTNIGTKASPRWAMFQQTTRVAITSANILAMFTTPVAVLAAPAAGRVIVVDSIMVTVVATATAYAAGGVVSFIGHGGSTAMHAGTIPAAVITAGAGSSFTQLGPAVAANGTTLTTATGIDITNATQAFTTGTGTAVVYITYSILPTA